MSPLELAEKAVVVATFLLVAFPIHEFSHAWAAYRLGDSTARYQGRLTLNPLVHFDPLGGTLLAISMLLSPFGFGWAKPTPVNPTNLRGGRQSEALVAVAGPLSNFVMACFAAVVYRIIDTAAPIAPQTDTSGSVNSIYGHFGDQLFPNSINNRGVTDHPFAMDSPANLYGRDQRMGKH